MEEERWKNGSETAEHMDMVEDSSWAGCEMSLRLSSLAQGPSGEEAWGNHSGFFFLPPFLSWAPHLPTLRSRCGRACLVTSYSHL